MILEKSKEEHGCSSVNRFETKETPEAEPDSTSSTLDPPLTWLWTSLKFHLTDLDIKWTPNESIFETILIINLRGTETWSILPPTISSTPSQ